MAGIDDVLERLLTDAQFARIWRRIRPAHWPDTS